MAHRWTRNRHLRWHAESALQPYSTLNRETSIPNESFSCVLHNRHSNIWNIYGLLTEWRGLKVQIDTHQKAHEINTEDDVTRSQQLDPIRFWIERRAYQMIALPFIFKIDFHTCEEYMAYSPSEGMFTDERGIDPHWRPTSTCTGMVPYQDPQQMFFQHNWELCPSILSPEEGVAFSWREVLSREHDAFFVKFIDSTFKFADYVAQ